MTPKEDPEEKRLRQSQRRQAEADAKRSAQMNARGLTSDLMSVYGAPSIFGMK